MEENFVAPPRRALLRGGLHENYVLIPMPPETPSYQRFELEMHLLRRRIPNPPASQESIESLEVVIVSKEDEKEGGVCPICLDDWEEGDVAKEMPCHHRYHGSCIRDWLSTCGRCPVCKYRMPVDFECVIRNVGGFRWLRENMRDNLARFLIMNSILRNQIEYVDGSIVPLGAQVNHLGDN